MAEFLSTKGIAFRIEQIITKARKELTLISPYLALSQHFYNRLKENTHVSIKLVYGKDKLTKDQWEQIHSLDHVELYFSENLHAKCYFNESNMVIGSMNLYEYSEINNREMGILLNADDDADLYEDAKIEANSIIIGSEIKKQIVSNSTEATKEKGYCVRCDDSIKFDPLAPFCKSCYKTWAYWGDDTFQEKFCHGCGEKKSLISKRMPQCTKCFKENPVFVPFM